MIRPYRTKDKKRLIEIFNLNVPKYFNINELKDFKNHLALYFDTYFTVEHKSAVVGSVGYQLNENENSGQICWIFFHPDYTGLGLGKKAVDYCLCLINSISNVGKIIVTTSQLAYGFFEKLNFKLIKITKDYWGPGLDLYLMERQMKNTNS